MNRAPLLLMAALLASVASASRQPVNLEPFAADQVCLGSVNVQVRGQGDARLAESLQGTLRKLGAGLKFSSAPYVGCPAWITVSAWVKGDGNGRFVYAATLALITPKVETRALGNLKDERFEYDGGLDFVTLWSSTGYNIAATSDDLTFRLTAEVVDQFGVFQHDWRARH